MNIKELKKESDEDLFNTFYDAWINKLMENHFVILLDSNVDIEKIVTGINEILVARGENTKLEVNEIVEKYNSELKRYLFNGNIITDKLNYDILEANIVAGELRKYGYELICLFNGYDNNIKTIIRIADIDKLKKIEEEIKK